AEDGIRDGHVTGVQTCALPICVSRFTSSAPYDSRLRGTLIQPDLRILDLAQQAKPVQRLPQQRAAFFEVRLIRLGLLPELAEPRSEERRVGKGWSARTCTVLRT